MGPMYQVQRIGGLLLITERQNRRPVHSFIWYPACFVSQRCQFVPSMGHDAQYNLINLLRLEVKSRYPRVPRVELDLWADGQLQT